MANLFIYKSTIYDVNVMTTPPTIEEVEAERTDVTSEIGP